MTREREVDALELGQRIANLLVLVANLGVLGITVKLYTEVLKDRKFDVREVRSGPSNPGTPGHKP